MAENDNPNGQPTAQPNGDQTDYKAQYLDLSAKIANGEYVAKNVYTGLQQKHEKEVLAHKADVDALTAANQKVIDLDGTLKALQGQFSELQATSATASTELAAEKARNGRLTLIMGKFPGLVEFEGQGLLPIASSDEELIEKLTKFQELHGARQQQQKEDRITGTSPTPGPKDTGATATSDQLLSEAKGLQRQGKYAEYNAKMDEYYKSLQRV